MRKAKRIQGVASEKCPYCLGTGQRPKLDELGEQLRKLRISKDFTLRYLAGELGISPTHLSDIERGNRRPSPELVERYRKLVAA